MKKIERTSPTLGAVPPPGAIVLFDGSNTNAWAVGKIEEGHLLGVPAVTQGKASRIFCCISSFAPPSCRTSRGQGRGNSGVYLEDQYEVQVLDSFGLEGLDNECGGIYKQAKPAREYVSAPAVLANVRHRVSRRPASAPTARSKRQNAVVTVRHNGVPIHYDLELKQATPGGHRADEHPGPIFLQDHGNPVRFRNIWIVVRP